VILVFDEIFLRESIHVNTRTLTYYGLDDFGNDFEKKTHEKANHGLVSMVQSLADNLQQHIAIFSLKGKLLFVSKNIKL